VWTTESEHDEVQEVDLLTAEERNMIDCLVDNVQNIVYNQEKNVVGTQGMDETVGDTQGYQEHNVGATQGTEEDNVFPTEVENLTQEKHSLKKL